MARHILLFCFIALGTGCSSLPPVNPPPSDTPGMTSPSHDLPGDPVLRELDTSRAHVVRISEAGVPGALGRLHVFAPRPGVMVAIDRGGQLPLPQNVDLEPGFHQVVATCPDGTTETYRASVEEAATVQLRVCARPMRP